MKYKVLIPFRDGVDGDILPVGSFFETDDKKRIGLAEKKGYIEQEKKTETKAKPKKKSGD